MNKFLFSIVLTAVVAAAFGTAGVAYAQTPTPQAPATGLGNGASMNRRGMHNGMGYGAGRGNNASGVGTGILHDSIVSYFAETLGLTVDEINTRLANGETMAQIAYSEGRTVAQFQLLMLEARSQAVDQAVKDGTLTQAQADWMKIHGTGAIQGGRSSGRGNGMGLHGNPDCPYYQANS